MTVPYSKEYLTIQCDGVVKIAQDLLRQDGAKPCDKKVLTRVERDCLEQLIPQVRIAAACFRQCSKNKEANNGEGR